MPPMDCSLPGSSVYGILQARILEWVDIPSSQGIFLTQGSNSHLLYFLSWQAHCLLLHNQGSPSMYVCISLVAKRVKNLPTVLQCGRPGFDPWVREDPLEKGMSTHSSILAWRIPWTKEPVGLQSMVSQRIGQN